jgi:DNA-binding MarR family transcriptional regulator
MKKSSDTLKFIIDLSKFQIVISRRLDSALGGLGLNEFIILLELNQAEGKLRRIDLAERIGLTASGITRLLLPMEKIGLVKREINKDDARSSFVILSPAGKRKFEEGLERAEIFCEDIFPIDKAKNLEDLSLFLKRLSGLNTILDSANRYAKEAKERWGKTDAYKQSQEKTKKLTKEDWEKINRKNEELLREIIAEMDKGPASAEVQKLIGRHYDALRYFYEPNLIMYRGLGNMYSEDPRFSAYYEKYKKGLAQFMKEAINAFCDARK